MAKTKTIDLEIVGLVPSPDAPDRAQRILTCYDGCKRSASQQVVYAFLAGIELTRQKQECGHGHFLRWCEENLVFKGLSYRTAARFMAFAEALQPKFATVANFDPDRLQITNGDIPDDQKEIILETIREAADGSSITDLYRELGVIRQPKRPGYTPPKKLTPDQEAAAREELANQTLRDHLLDLEQFPTVLQDATDRDLLEQIDALYITNRKLLTEMLRAWKPKSKSRK